MGDSSREFYDRMGGDEYAAAIERCVPRYAEMLRAIVDYLPPGFSPRRILELGCGTGNLSQLAARAFPDAHLHLVDFSSEMLDHCRVRFIGAARVSFEQADFRQLDFEPASFDLAISSIALHHLTHDEQRQLFDRLGNWLAPGGWLSYADQFSAATDENYRKHIADWRAQAKALGASDEEWQRWMTHQREHDHHAPLMQHVDWLNAARFECIDVVRRHLLWTVIQARR